MAQLLPAVIDRYKGCSSVTTDACGSLQKQVADTVKPMVEKGEFGQLLDIWHQQKRIYWKYIAYIDSKCMGKLISKDWGRAGGKAHLELDGRHL